MKTEDLHTEFKASFGDEVIETLVAFANAKGGSVRVGINDEGEPINNFAIGRETLQNWINEIKTKTHPSIIPDAEVIRYQNKDVVEFTIQEFPIKPVSYRGRYFKRVKNSNHQLTLTEIADMHLKTFNTSWDNYPSHQFALKDIAIEKVRQFIALSNRIRENQIQDDPLTVLKKYELLKDDGRISNACHLLFAENDIFSATVSVIRFSRDTIIKDSLVMRADLFSEVDAILSFIRKHINKNYVITGKIQRDERWEYPLNAIREIIINMVVHRDYQNPGDSFVKIYDDHIEFFNPGLLPNELTVGQLLSGNYVSFARNRKIADMFREAGVIEKYGDGIKRIMNTFQVEGLKVPDFESYQHGFKVSVFSSESARKPHGTDNDTDNDTDKRLKAIITSIKENDRVTISQLAKKHEVSAITIKRDLNRLKKHNLLERIGKEKGGHWQIVEKAIDK